MHVEDPRFLLNPLRLWQREVNKDAAGGREPESQGWLLMLALAMALVLILFMRLLPS
jgi:hypothetical protein